MRRAAGALIAGAVVLALAGCGSTVEGTAAAPSSDPSAQSDLRPPVNATAAEPTAPSTKSTSARLRHSASASSSMVTTIDGAAGTILSAASTWVTKRCASMLPRSISRR